MNASTLDTGVRGALDGIPTVAGGGDRAKVRALPWALLSGILSSVFGLWTFGGSVFVLFLNELGLPKGRIGVMLSFFPFCGLITLGFAPVAVRRGRKRVFLAGYGLRKLVMALLLLLLPWVTTRFGSAAAIGFLSAVIIVFAVLRALAETAIYPWMQEFIPNRVRGRFAAWSAVTGLVASAVALAVAGKALETARGLTGYLFLIGAGSALGLLGVLLHAKVPGGAPIPRSPEDGHHLENMAAALRDRNYVAYLGGMAGLTIGSAMLVLLGDRRFETPLLTIDGYTVMFGAAILFLAAGGLLYRRVRPDDRYTTHTAVRSFLNRIAQR